MNLYAVILVHAVVVNGKTWNIAQQLFYKNQEVFNNLKRIGKIELPDFEPIMGSEKQFFYRNKMEFSFSNAVGKQKPKYKAEKKLKTVML